MIARELLESAERGWGSAPVLVVGDVMLDQYVWGEVERISPEAPVPVVRATMRDERAGGAANVAVNLARLGARVTVVGFAGGDPEQERLAALLSAEGIESRLVTTDDAPTTTKLRILSGHQQIMRLDSEARASHRESEYAVVVAQRAGGAAGSGGGCAFGLREGSADGRSLPDDHRCGGAAQDPSACRSQSRALPDIAAQPLFVPT